MEFDSSFCILAFISISLALFYYLRQSNNEKEEHLPPGPFAWPVIGNPSHVVRVRPYAHFCGELRRRYGDVVLLYVGRTPLIIVNDFDVAVEAFVTKYPKELAGRPKSLLFDAFMEGCNDIVASDYGPRWKTHRKLSHAALRKFAQGRSLELHTMQALRKFADHLRSHPDLGDRGFDPYSLLRWMTYNIMCLAIFNKEYEREDSEFRWLTDIIEEANSIFSEKAIVDFIPGAAYLPFSPLQRVREISVELSKYLEENIEQHRSVLTESSEPVDITDYLLREQAQSLLDGDKRVGDLHDDHIRLTLQDIFTAGGDTTGLSLYWMMGLLASHPHVQEKVYKEVANLASTLDEDPCIGWKEKLPYCNATLHELMRHGVIAPLGLVHVARSKCKIGEFDVQKGSWVLMNQFSFNTDPKYWRNPEEFNPENFLDEEGNLAPKKRGFMIFGCGRRVCLGEIVAKNELFLIIIMLCKDFRLIWSEDNATDRIVESVDNKFMRFPQKFKIKIIKR